MTDVQLATRYDYIYAAGLFDGEGSAVLLRPQRKLNGNPRADEDVISEAHGDK